MVYNALKKTFFTILMGKIYWKNTSGTNAAEKCRIIRYIKVHILHCFVALGLKKLVFVEKTNIIITQLVNALRPQLCQCTSRFRVIRKSFCVEGSVCLMLSIT